MPVTQKVATSGQVPARPRVPGPAVFLGRGLQEPGDRVPGPDGTGQDHGCLRFRDGGHRVAVHDPLGHQEVEEVRPGRVGPPHRRGGVIRRPRRRTRPAGRCVPGRAASRSPSSPRSSSTARRGRCPPRRAGRRQSGRRRLGRAEVHQPGLDGDRAAASRASAAAGRSATAVAGRLTAGPRLSAGWFGSWDRLDRAGRTRRLPRRRPGPPPAGVTGGRQAHLVGTACPPPGCGSPARPGSGRTARRKASSLPHASRWWRATSRMAQLCSVTATTPAPSCSQSAR